MRAAVAVTICGSSIHSSVQLAPDRSCSCTSASCMPESCVALKRASATSTSAITGLCLCGMAEEPPPPASAISLPSSAISATSCPNLPRLPVTSDSQLANSRGCRAGCAIAARRRGRGARQARCAPPAPCRQIFPACRPRRRTARPTAAATARDSRSPVPFERLPPRSDAVATRGSGSPPACASRPSAPLAPKRALMRDEAPDQRRRAAVEALDDRLQAEHQRRVDDILAGGTEMHFCADAARRPPRATAAPARARRGRRAPRRPAACPGPARTNPARLRSPRAAAWPMMPSAASASASARSKATIAASSAFSRKLPRRLLVAEDRRQQRVIERRNGHAHQPLSYRRRPFPSPPGDGYRRYRCRRRVARSGSARARGARCAPARGPRHWPFPRRRNTCACAVRY